MRTAVIGVLCAALAGCYVPGGPAGGFPEDVDLRIDDHGLDPSCERGIPGVSCMRVDMHVSFGQGGIEPSRVRWEALMVSEAGTSWHGATDWEPGRTLQGDMDAVAFFDWSEGRQLARVHLFRQDDQGENTLVATAAP